MHISLNYRFIIQLVIILTLASLILNLLLSNILWLSYAELPLWGQQSVATHLLFYSVLAGFILGWVATKATRRALRNRKVLPLHWHRKSQTLIDKLPSKTFSRSFMFALAGFSIAAILLFLLSLLRLSYIPYYGFQELLIIYTICFSAAITLMAVYRALGDKIMRHSKV